MPPHRMTHDGLTVEIDGKGGSQDVCQFVGDIGSHPIMLIIRGLGRIDVEAGALSEIIGLVVGNTFAPRARIGRHEDEPQFSADAAILALVGDIGMGAGETGKIEDDRAGRLCVGLRRDEDGKGHRRAGRSTRMANDMLSAAVGPVDRDGVESVHQ